MPHARRALRGGRMVLAGPPAESLANARIVALPAGTTLRRVYWPEPWKVTATTFRRNGPRSRFDHHRRPGPYPDHGDDPERAVFYCAPTFACCILECFGDEWLIDPTGARLAVLETTAELQLLDLRGDAAVDAGTLAAINQDGDREVTQDWARWWYEQLETIDGLLFSGSHNDDDAIAMFERADGRFKAVYDEPLETVAELVILADRLEITLLSSGS